MGGKDGGKRAMVDIVPTIKFEIKSYRTFMVSQNKTNITARIGNTCFSTTVYFISIKTYKGWCQKIKRINKAFLST